jgi:4'-phosphopantetheinyl transferase
MTLHLPPLGIWHESPATTSSLEGILPRWKVHDTLTFLVDLGMYHPTFRTFLDPGERERELLFKTVISRKRFVVSRTILKHIFQAILQTGNAADVVLIRKNDGRILVKDVPGIYISLSYSGTCTAITVGKRKIGSDMELVRPVAIRKIKSCPLFEDKKSWNEKERNRNFLHLWTLIEAYAKLHDSNPYPYLTWKVLPQDANFVSYCINNSSIFSLAYGLDRGRDALFQLDSEGIGDSV